DWLEQGGNPTRAEMIRLGVELAQLGGLPRPSFGCAGGLRVQTDVERARAEAIRARMLALNEHVATWTRELPTADDVRWSTALDPGGMLQGLVAPTWRAFQAVADRLAAKAPIRAAELDRLDGRDAKAMIRSGWLRRLRYLSVHGGKITPSAIANLLGH